MNEERLEFLLDRYFDEALRPAEKAELEAALLAWPQARALFWERARFHALLRRRGRESWGRRLATEPGGARTVRAWRENGERWLQHVRPLGWWAAAAAAAMVLIFLSLSRVGPPESRRPAVKTTGSTAATLAGQGIATIRRAVEVQWTGPRERPGNVLGPGPLKFARGVVELEFHRGARLVIEGPADFDLITDMQVRCRLGKLRADVPPPAVGFEILAPNVRVVDRGTAFGMEVAPGGTTEIHVFSGSVDYAPARQRAVARLLVAGKAVRLDPAGTPSEIPLQPAAFTTGNTVEQRAATAMAARFSAWRADTARLRSDPTLLVQYTFDPASLADRTLHNDAPGAAPETHGTIIGCGLTEGRWPGKPALDFKQAGDRVRLALPRQHEQLTAVAWVRLDSLERPFTALLMSSDAALGELQWQFDKEGRLIFGKRLIAGWGGPNVERIDTQPLLTPWRAGTWVQLAFVYDGRVGTLTHYLDGEMAGAGPVSITPPLATGALEIGNWAPAGGDPLEPTRAFAGRMDEFLIFSRALRAEEILELWKTGRPL